jgi:hypothetical protein
MMNATPSGEQRLTEVTEVLYSLFVVWRKQERFYVLAHTAHLVTPLKLGVGSRAVGKRFLIEGSKPTGSR